MINAVKKERDLVKKKKMVRLDFINGSKFSILDHCDA